MSIYTRKGDGGQTSIIGGRLSKASNKVAAYGTVDEANSFIGLALAHLPEREQVLRAELEKIQHQLFDCGSDLSKKPGVENRFPYLMKEEPVSFLEERIDAYMAEAGEIKRFILPGGTPAAAYLHVARTVVRRAERLTVRLAEEEPVNPWVLRYLNRLSDYLFALARVINYRAGRPEVAYRPGGPLPPKQEKSD